MSRNNMHAGKNERIWCQIIDLSIVFLSTYEDRNKIPLGV